MQDMYAKIYVLQSFFAIFLRSAKFFAPKFPELEKIYTWSGVSIFTPFSLHSRGVIPVSRRKTREKTAGEENPHEEDIDASFKSGLTAISCLASSTR